MKTFVVSPIRTTSSRMRGKIFWNLNNKSMLEHFIERVQRAKLIDGIVIACPPRDFMQFSEMATPWGVRTIAPEVEEWDLVGRHYQTAKAIGADISIRICADNPCVEWEEIDRLIEHAQYLKMPCRTLHLNSEHPEYDFDGFGGELYTMEMLEWMDGLIESQYYREHPHKLWWDMNSYSYVGKMYPQGFRLEVNYENELQKLDRIFAHFGHNEFHIIDVIKFLEAEKMMGA